MNNMYAPIAIITLNRYVHLRRCVESFEKCTWADRTDIFISVDFPPDEKYEEGYKKVVEYLKYKDWSGFKKAHIYFQNKNLGPIRNMKYLHGIIKKDYEMCINTEDDNEFMPGYLVFANRGYQLFKDDPEFFNMCGYSKVNASSQGYYKTPSITWGSTYEFKKREEAARKIQKIFKNKILSGKEVKKICCVSVNLFEFYVNFLLYKTEVFFDETGNIASIDVTQGIYMILENKYSIIPALSLVKNHGYDGSGLNCGEDKDFGKDLIVDRGKRFEFVKGDLSAFKKYMKKNIYHDKLFYKTLIKYIIIRLVGLKTARRIIK